MNSIVIILVIFFSIMSIIRKTKVSNDKYGNRGETTNSQTRNTVSQNNTTKSVKTNSTVARSVNSSKNFIVDKKTNTEEKKKIATRFVEGERVANGYRKIVCGYCGAESIVPTYAKETYGCYFCHEKI